MLAIILIATLTNFSFAKGDVYSTCYEYETYCLFSFGPNVTVNNVKEAQKICEDAKHGSWLLEIVDDRTLKNVEKFLSSHSFPKDTKLILNAEQFNRQWKWIKNKSELAPDKNHLKLLNDTLFHHRLARLNNNESHQFSFICMTECFSKFDKRDKMRFLGATIHGNMTTEECRQKCEVSECEVYEWDPTPDPRFPHFCWIHKTIKGKVMFGNINGTLYIIDRSVKTTNVCVGNITEPPSGKSHSNGYSASNFDFNIYYIILGIPILIVMVVIVVIIIIWRRNKKRKEGKKSNVTHIFPVAWTGQSQIVSSSSSSSPTTTNRVESEKPNKNSNCIVYADLFFRKGEETVKESTITGPMGDIYAQVNRK